MNNDIPVLLIVPGITGHSRDNYVKHLVHDGLVEGYRPVVFNQRGTGIKLKVSFYDILVKTEWIITAGHLTKPIDYLANSQIEFKISVKL